MNTEQNYAPNTEGATSPVQTAQNPADSRPKQDERTSDTATPQGSLPNNQEWTHSTSFELILYSGPDHRTRDSTASLAYQALANHRDGLLGEAASRLERLISNAAERSTANLEDVLADILRVNEIAALTDTITFNISMHINRMYISVKKGGVNHE